MVMEDLVTSDIDHRHSFSGLPAFYFPKHMRPHWDLVFWIQHFYQHVYFSFVVLGVKIKSLGPFI